MLYDWVKAMHVIAVIAWMAGMLYLPRLYVYHVTAVKGGELSETLKVMERRLLRAIINPAMVATFLFGGWMLYLNTALLSLHWMHAKLVLVLAMSALHGLLARWRKAFAMDSNRHSANFFRTVNEIPTLFLIGIVILVIVKPF